MKIILMAAAAMLMLAGCGDSKEQQIAKLIEQADSACYRDKDYTKAVELYGQAAELGSANGQYEMGVFYFEGLGVPQKDYKKGRELIMQAAEQDYPDALGLLGYAYLARAYGFSRNDGEAFKYASRGAELGNALAQDVLGDIYFNGYSVKKDAAKAVEWLEKSAAQGRAHAISNLIYIYANGADGVEKNPERADYWRNWEPEP